MFVWDSLSFISSIIAQKPHQQRLCRRSITHLQFWDGEDNLQIWKLVAKIMHNWSQRADMGWTSSLGFGRVSNNFTTPETNMIKMLLGPW